MSAANLQSELIDILESTAERQTAVDGDGYIYDVQTGEVLGHASVNDLFRIETDEAAGWTLELRSRLEGDVAGIEARLRAVTEQLTALRTEKMQRLAWWDWKFYADLVAYTRKALRGSKARTKRYGWGSVSFRATPGNREIVAMDAAIEFVKGWAPELVKIRESVGIKDVLEAKRLALSATGEDEPLPFMVESGPSESVTVSTGIETASRLPSKKDKRS